MGARGVGEGWVTCSAEQQKEGIGGSLWVVSKVDINVLFLIFIYLAVLGFPGGSDGKESTCSAGDQGSIPGSGRPPGEENENPLQYSCLENSMDRGV